MLSELYGVHMAWWTLGKQTAQALGVDAGSATADDRSIGLIVGRSVPEPRIRPGRAGAGCRQPPVKYVYIISLSRVKFYLVHRSFL